MQAYLERAAVVADMNHEMFIVGSTYWNIAYGQMPGDVLKDEEGMSNMRNLGENMAWILSKIHNE